MHLDGREIVNRNPLDLPGWPARPSANRRAFPWFAWENPNRTFQQLQHAPTGRYTSVGNCAAAVLEGPF